MYQANCHIDIVESLVGSYTDYTDPYENTELKLKVSVNVDLPLLAYTNSVMFMCKQEHDKPQMTLLINCLGDVMCNIGYLLLVYYRI